MFLCNKLVTRSLVLLGALSFVTAQAAQVVAGQEGSEFLSLVTKLKGWAGGSLGIALSLAAFIIGGLIGLAKSTLMPALVGVAFAIMFSVVPNVIVSMFGALI
jgi:conjugal transfer pilus assembly protein TraA